MKLPSLRTLVQGAHRMGAISNRFRVSNEEAQRIRDAEKSGGQEAGLKIVLQILREKNRPR